MNAGPTHNDDPFALARYRMVEEQLRPRGITDEAVLEVMGTIPRERFLPPEIRQHAYEDRALPIGLGQTISQPYIVAYMTSVLQPTPSARVLEIGTGTGYQTAILAQLAAHVYSIERMRELHERARDTLEALGITNVSLFLGDGTLGLPEHAPFDRIIVTAGGPRVPSRLLEQLGDEGVLVAPVGGETDQRLVRVTRRGNTFQEETLLGCRFVKLIGEEGWREETSP